MTRFTIFLYLYLTFSVVASAQIVNIEDRRAAASDTTAWFGQVDLGFDLKQNGSDILTLLGGIQAEYLQKRQRYLGVISFNQIIINDNNFVNEGVVHFRYNNDLSERISGEIFLQGQFNERLALAFRGLAGTGARLELFQKGNQKAFLGVAYMYEYDQIWDSTLVFNDHRLSTYLSFQLRPLDNLTISSTNYYQPKLDPWGDYRLSSKSEVSIQISRQFSFITAFSISFDTRLDRELPEVPSTIYAFTNRLRFSF
jgi:putative salt-induced outer membrane protein YdiY